MVLDASKIKTVFFDLDGTLIDNFAAIYRCYVDISNEMGLFPRSFEDLRQAVGGSISLTLSRLIGEDLAPEGVVRFRKHFPDVMFEDVFALNGAQWLLAKLREQGVRCAVFTNKHHGASKALLDHLGLSTWLDAIYGTEMPEAPWRKPEKEFSEYVLQNFGASPTSSLMIGDSPFDIAAAQAVNMPVACVTTGTHLREPLVEASGHPEMVFPDLYSLGNEIFNFKQ